MNSIIDNIIDNIKNAKSANRFPIINQQRNSVLSSLAENLIEESPAILEENAKDLALMSKEDPKYDRLLLSRDRIKDIANDIISVSSLESPIGKILSEIKRPNGLLIKKISVPLGVVAVVYESRPNVTVDVFSLCFKSGNACILKGGKEAYYTNSILVRIIKKVLQRHNINSDIIYLAPSNREAINVLLKAQGMIDVCIPRGSKDLINFVRDNATIPIIETGAGVVHTYFDASGDVNKGIAIINNAKTRRVSVCNALDTLIIHKSRVDDLHKILEPIREYNVEIFADEISYDHIKNYYNLLKRASFEDFGKEFLSYKMSIKVVGSVQDAVEHITQYSSGHSEAIIAEDEEVISYFLNMIDAAVLYVNASTAFTDGAQFGMGAEIGISTQKLHTRGPTSLEGLTSYKWIVYGNGHIRA